MAGDWLKIERATLDKPEVYEMAEILGISSDEVVGKLLRVWFWFDEQTEDGNARNVTNETIVKRIGMLSCNAGFAQAMQKVGWLNGTRLPNFDRHNGKTAKNRALTNARVKRFRNDATVTDALPEKRIEEVNTTTSSLRSDVSPLQPVLEEQTPKDTTSVTSTTPRGSRFKMVKLPSAWAAFCREERPDLEPGAVFESFRDYWVARAGEKGVKLDWQATWRNWVRKEKRAGNGQTPGEVMANWAEAEIDRL